MKRSSSLATLALSVALVAPVSAEVPEQVRLQGLLLGSDGTPLAGPVVLSLGLYDSQSASAPLYSEVHAAVPLSDGRFSVALGADPVDPSAPGLTETLASEDAVWLGMAVDGALEVPRQQLLSVPFAVHAEAAREASTLAMTCTPGYLLRYGGAGWECVDPSDAELACGGCSGTVEVGALSLAGLIFELLDEPQGIEDVYELPPWLQISIAPTPKGPQSSLNLHFEW